MTDEDLQLHNMSKEQRISAIYGALQGRLAQTTLPTSANHTTHMKDQVKHFHRELDWLAEVIGGANLNAYRVTEKKGSEGKNIYYDLTEFRQQMNAVIMLLYRLYFVKERIPFGGEPQVIVNQQQSQSQQQQLTMIKVLNITLVVSVAVTIGFYLLVRLFNLAF